MSISDSQARVAKLEQESPAEFTDLSLVFEREDSATKDGDDLLRDLVTAVDPLENVDVSAVAGEYQLPRFVGVKELRVLLKKRGLVMRLVLHRSSLAC